MLLQLPCEKQTQRCLVAGPCELSHTQLTRVLRTVMLCWQHYSVGCLHARITWHSTSMFTLSYRCAPPSLSSHVPRSFPHMLIAGGCVWSHLY